MDDHVGQGVGVNRVAAGGVDVEDYEGVGVGNEVVRGQLIGCIAESRSC